MPCVPAQHTHLTTSTCDSNRTLHDLSSTKVALPSLFMYQDTVYLHIAGQQSFQAVAHHAVASMSQAGDLTLLGT